MANNTTFFDTTMTFVNDTFGLTLLTKVNNFIMGISPIIEIGFGIFLLLWVLNFWANGSFTEMGIDFVKKCIAWSLIIALCANADQYAKVAKLIYELDNDISSLFAGQKFDGNTLDIALNGFFDIEDDLKKTFSKYDVFDKIAHSFNYVSNLWVLKICGAIFLMVSFATYLIHKILLVLALLVGPLATGLGLFPSTRNYMMNWINQCASLVLTCVLIGLVGQFQLLYLNTIKPTPDSWDISDLALFNVSLLLGTILFSIIVYNVPNLASALTGGGATGSGLSFGKGMATGMATGSATAQGTKAVGKRIAKKFGWGKKGEVSDGGS